MRRSSMSLLVFALLVVVGGAVWWVLQGQPEDQAIAELARPRVSTMEPVRLRETIHREKYPYGAFEQEMNDLRAPEGVTKEIHEQRLMLANELKIYHRKMPWDFDDADPYEVIRIIREALKPTGVAVISYPDLLKAEVEDLHFTIHGEMTLEELIDKLRGQSGERFRYYVTSQGLCLGGTSSIQQCQWDAREALAKKLAEPDRKAALLEKEFRPDFGDAGIIAIHRQITKQTGVEVIVAATLWHHPKVITWRADPMPLRDALDEICKHFKCVYRVKDGRVFLMEP
jgi:hypothetical protein